MKINNNIVTANMKSQLSVNSSASAKTLEKLSGSLSINKAGDTAVGLSIADRMKSRVREISQTNSNAQTAISTVQTAVSALDGTSAALQRMRDLALQSSFDSNSESDRAKIQEEINTLTSEINRLGSTTAFNNEKLLDGSFSSSFQMDGASIHIDDMRAQALGVSSSVTGQNQNVSIDNKPQSSYSLSAGVDNGLSSAKTEYALDVTTVSNALSAVDKIDTAMKAVTAEKSKLGNYSITFEHIATNLSQSIQNSPGAALQLKDVDMAKNMMDLTKSNMLNKTSEAMLAQANQQPQGVLQLLR